MYEVIGFKEVNYNRKSDGKHIEGISLFVIGDPEYPDERMHGREAMSLWLSSGKALSPPSATSSGPSTTAGATSRTCRAWCSDGKKRYFSRSREAGAAFLQL